MVAFAIPPMVRFTRWGIPIRQVGTASLKLPLKIQLPHAIPNIMTGVNQTVMRSLSMGVVATIIGTGGLGASILDSIQRIDLGVGREAGLSILIIVIALDCFFQGLTLRQKKALIRD